MFRGKKHKWYLGVPKRIKWTLYIYIYIQYFIYNYYCNELVYPIGIERTLYKALYCPVVSLWLLFAQSPWLREQHAPDLPHAAHIAPLLRWRIPRHSIAHAPEGINSKGAGRDQ